MKFAYPYAQISASKLTLVNFSEKSLLLGFSFFALVIPVVFHSQAFPNQIIVGTIVNALLALCALYLTFKNSLPVILLPSLAALFSGFIFGSFTVFLTLLVPFIWVGNAVYVHVIKSFAVAGKMNYWVSVFGASMLKAAIIGLSTFILVSVGLVPQILLFPMSAVQFATAVLGGLLAGISLTLRK